MLRSARRWKTKIRRSNDRIVGVYGGENTRRDTFEEKEKVCKTKNIRKDLCAYGTG